MEDDREPAADPLVTETERERHASAAARLFDIRRVIGALFVGYGLIVGLIGVFDGPAEIDKAQGLRINLWAGLVLLVLGLLFLLWQWRRPVDRGWPPPRMVPAIRGSQPGRPARNRTRGEQR